MVIYKHIDGSLISENKLKSMFEKNKREGENFKTYAAKMLESKALRVAYQSNVTVKIVERERQSYCGFELRKGEFFGKDETGIFVWDLSCESAKDVGKSTLKLMRFDPARGWFISWEKNATTKAIEFVAIADNKWKYRKQEMNWSNGTAAPIMEVHNDNGVRHMGKYDGKPRFSSTVGFAFGKEVKVVGTPDLVGMEAKDGSKYANIYKRIVQPPAMGF